MEKDDLIQQLQDMDSILAPPSLIPNVLARLGLENTEASPDVSIEALTLALRDDRWQVRLSAVRQLRRLSGQEADALLATMVHDEDEFVHMTALEALRSRHMGTSPATGTLPFHSELTDGCSPTVEVSKLLAEQIGTDALEETQEGRDEQAQGVETETGYVTTSREAVHIFSCYTYADESWWKELEERLGDIHSQNFMIKWHCCQIHAGKEWTREIDAYLDMADIILLLVSPDFLASSYCNIEMMRSIERHRAGEARVIPILLRPAYLKDVPFFELKILPSNGKPITHWSDRDEAFEDVVKGISQVVEDIAHSTARSLSKEASVRFAFPSVRNIPYPPNPFFTGREGLLQRLHEALAATKTAILAQPYDINGLGGIGKTQIAVEYAHRYSNDYQAVLWVKATTRETLIADFVTLAEQLHPPRKDVQGQNIVVATVKRWLVNHSNWLFILDDVADLDMIHDFLPLEITGHMLLTTRQHAHKGIVSSIEVERMDKDEGSLLLLRRSGRLAAKGQLYQAPEVDRARAEEIAMAMDGLPLALNQAGAYIEQTGCDLSEYLNLYQTRFRELIRLPNNLVSSYREAVATTWSLSFKKIEKENKAAGALLRLCAFLAPYPIPEEIISKGATHLDKILGSVATDSSKLDEAMEVLQRYSLTRRNSETKTLIIHHLVQAVFKERMNAKTQRLWAMRVIQAVDAVFPEVTYGTWSDCQRYLLHAQACANLVAQYQFTSPEAARLLTNAGWYLRERALYAQAEPLLTHALVIRVHALGLQHPDTATSCNNLAQLFRLRGEYRQAEALCQRALTIREHVLGPQDPDIASTLHDLGHIYYFQGEFKKAESFYQRALAIRENILGPLHPHTATTFNHLGMLYHSQGKYEKAERFYERALAIREQMLDPEDPLIATALNGLALLYYAQGKYKKAEKLFQRALAIRERSLGAEHHHTTITLNHLGMLYQELAKYDQAESLHQSVLRSREQALGPQHPDIAFALNDLARLYHAQGRYEEAEPLYQRALAIKEQKLSFQHPGTATTLANLARLYQDQGRYEEAEPLYQRALAIRIQMLSPEHPHTLSTLNDLSHLYRLQGRYALAEPLCQFVLTVREQVLGSDHPHTAVTLSNLACLYEEQGRYEEAEQLHRRVLPIRERVLGHDHPDTAATLQSLAMLSQRLGRYKEAEPEV